MTTTFVRNMFSDWRVPVPPFEFIIDSSNSSPSGAVTYAGNNASSIPASYKNGVFDYGSWKNAFFMPRPVMVKNDGTVDYELNHNDYSQKLSGGTSDYNNTSYAGNCMIAFPQVWMKFVQDDSTHQHVYISDKQEDSGYHCYTHQNKNGTWLDEIFVQAFDVSNVSSKARSLAGQTPMYSVGGTTMQTYAQANGSSWDFMDYGTLNMIQMLLILMGKSLDTRTVFGTGICGNSYNPSATTGSLYNKGMFSASAWGTTTGTNPIKVFGIENLWGNYYKWINGLVSISGALKYKLCDYTTDGSTVTAYNTTGDGYKSLATYSGTQSGYLSKLALSSDGLLCDFSSLGGSSSTYYCTSCHLYSGGSYFAFFGGVWNNGAGYVGPFRLHLDNALSGSDSAYGCSLACKKL